MARSKLARRSETFEILDEMMRLISKDERDWGFRHFTRHIQRTIQSAIRSAVSRGTNARGNDCATRLKQAIDVGVEGQLDVSRSEIVRVTQDQRLRAIGAIRGIIYFMARALQRHFESIPVLGDLLRSMRSTETSRGSSPNQLANATKSFFRQRYGTSIETYMKRRSVYDRIFNARVLRALPEFNVVIPKLSFQRYRPGVTLGRALTRGNRELIISRFLYLYGLRDTTSSTWTWPASHNYYGW